MRVAFLGLGRMGRAMATHVVRAGHELVVWNRTPGKADELVGLGAREAGDVLEAVSEAEAVVLMLFGPESDAALLGAVVQGAPTGALVVDSTTVGPDDARRNAEMVRGAGMRYVEAPVAGTVGPASEGTLTVFVGASDDDFSAALPLLELWGDPDQVRHVGDVGAASSLKLVVNLALGVAIEGVGEALRLADRLGVDRDAALTALAGGPLARTVTQKRQMIESGEFAPTMFSLELLAKDLALCLAASDHDAGLRATAAALESARAGVEQGRGGDDYARLADVVRRGGRG